MHSQKVKTSKDAFVSNDELPLNLMTAGDVQTLCADPWGVLPRHRILITAEVCDSRPLANPMGKSPGRFAKKRESALMPLSPGNIFATNPLPFGGFPWGCPGVYPPGWPLIPALKVML